MQCLQIDRAKGATKLPWRAMTYVDSPAELPLPNSAAVETFEASCFCREDFKGRHYAKTERSRISLSTPANTHSTAICSSCR